MSSVRELRKAANVKQECMAELIGVSRASYSKKESGQVKYTLEEAKRIADFFGKSIENVFFDSEDSNSDGIVTTFCALPELSEREKMREAAAEEIMQMLKRHNLTVDEAHSVLNSVECIISRSVEEIPVGITVKEISEMQAICKYAEKNRRRSKRLLAVMSVYRRKYQSKGQGFELPYRP